MCVQEKCSRKIQNAITFKQLRTTSVVCLVFYFKASQVNSTVLFLNTLFKQHLCALNLTLFLVL